MMRRFDSLPVQSLATGEMRHGGIRQTARLPSTSKMSTHLQKVTV